MEIFKPELNFEKLITEGSSTAKSEILTNTEKTPIYLSVDTGIDYVTIITGTLGFIVAALAAWFTLSIQRNQIQANISTLRHHWMTELRICGSELLQEISLLANELKTIKNYKATDDYVTQYSRIIILQTKLELLLSRDDFHSDKIRKTTSNLISITKNIKYQHHDAIFFNEIEALRSLLRSELEKAWTDIKDDLGINRKFFGIRFAKRKKTTKD